MAGAGVRAARGILVLAVLLTLFIATDHSVRAAPDHYALEQWRDTDAIDACGLCGAVCEYDDSKPAPTN